MNLFDLTDEVAVVIGGTGVLGGGMAEALARAGARVAILGRNQERGMARAKSITAHGAEAQFICANAQQKESLEAAAEMVKAAFGPPTVLLNAAGGNDPKVTVAAGKAFEEITLADWNESFDLNLAGGVLLPCQVFGPRMVAQGKGSIINIASVSSHIPLSRVVAYSAAKAAVVSLTQFLAREWASKGVRVNSITPGFFPAEQNRKILFNEDGTPSERTRNIWAHTPMGRFGRAEELAGAVIYLASWKASSFVTGADLRVDGGFLCQTI
jgi:NAD(P)-dependent dehydrogenase (short-subunit alcohol dehydrogenase family)